MKKIVLGLLLIMATSSIVYATTKDYRDDYFKGGKHIKKIMSENAQISNKEDEDIIYENSLIEITNIDIKKEVAVLSNNNNISDGEIAKKAIEEIIERKTMVATAEALGYEITDNDFSNYKEELINSLSKAENSEEIQAYFDGFGGTEEYFNIMQNQLREGLLVRKYLDDEMKKYAEKKGYDAKDIEFVEIWQRKEREIIKDKINNNSVDNSSEQEMINMALEYLSKK